MLCIMPQFAKVIFFLSYLSSFMYQLTYFDEEYVDHSYLTSETLVTKTIMHSVKVRLPAAS